MHVGNGEPGGEESTPLEISSGVLLVRAVGKAGTWSVYYEGTMSAVGGSYAAVGPPSGPPCHPLY